MYYLYLHINTINNKKYCGITKNPKRRFRGNGVDYKGTPFYEAIKKYGWNNFEHIIIKTVETLEEAEQLEIEYIAKYNLTDSNNGYNIQKGGAFDGKPYKEHPRGMLGKTHSEEYKKRLKIIMRGENNPFKKSGGWATHEHPRGMLGKSHSEEKKKQISNTLKEKKINYKKVQITYSDGSITVYDSITELCNKLDLSVSTVYKIIDTNIPYKINPNTHSELKEKLKYLEGAIINRITDNIELTD